MPGGRCRFFLTIPGEPLKASNDPFVRLIPLRSKSRAGEASRTTHGPMTGAHQNSPNLSTC